MKKFSNQKKKKKTKHDVSLLPKSIKFASVSQLFSVAKQYFCRELELAFTWLRIRHFTLSEFIL